MAYGPDFTVYQVTEAASVCGWWKDAQRGGTWCSAGFLWFLFFSCGPGFFYPWKTAAHTQGGPFLVNLGDAHTPKVFCANAPDILNQIKLAFCLHTTVARCSWLELTRLKQVGSPERCVLREQNEQDCPFDPVRVVHSPTASHQPWFCVREFIPVAL